MSSYAQSGFCDIQRVSSYNLIHDTSIMHFKDYKISLNLIAKKCFDGIKKARRAVVDGIEIPPLPEFKINITEYDPYDS